VFIIKGKGLGERVGGQNFERKKCKRHKCNPKTNSSIKFHLDRTMGKCSKLEGKVWEEKWEEFRRTKMQTLQMPWQNESWRKFHPNRTMEVFKIRGKIGDGLTDMENLRYSLKTLSLRLSNIFLKGISKRGFEKRFLGTMDISSYMQSEQARLAGKHLTRLSSSC